MKIIYTLLMVSVLSLQIYALFYVFPKDKEIYEKCQIKIMCELDKIDSPICGQYTQDVVVLNITDII